MKVPSRATEKLSPSHFMLKNSNQTPSCRNATIYRASSHHLFLSIFTTRMVGMDYYHPHSTDKEIETLKSSVTC